MTIFKNPDIVERLTCSLFGVILAAVIFYFYFKKSLSNEKNQSFQMVVVAIGGMLLFRFLYWHNTFFPVNPLVLNNILYFLGALGVAYEGHRIFPRYSWSEVFLVLCILISGLGKSLIGYNYQYDLSWLTYCGDFAILMAVCFQIGNLFGLRNTFLKINTGLAILTLVATAFTAFTLNRYIPSILPEHIHWVLIAVELLIILAVPTLSPIRALEAHKHLFYKSPYQTLWIILALAMLPTLPGLVQGGPGDSDITSILEMIGFHFQGQNLHHAVTGFAGETIGIRYPAGLSSLAYAISLLLNVRGAQALFLIWYLAHGLLTLNIFILARRFRVNPYLAVLFLLSPTVLYWGGFIGGQVQEALAYAIGLSALALSLRDRSVAATCAIAAGAVVQPVVIIPFAIAHLYCFFRDIKQRNLGSLSGQLTMGLLVAIYFYSINHGSNLPSQPEILVKELTFLQFFKNIAIWLFIDTSKLAPLILAIIILPFVKEYPKKLAFTLLGWLVGSFILDGTLGHTHWGARNHASFSIIALFAISVSVVDYLLRNRKPWLKPHLVTFGLITIWLIQVGPTIPTYAIHSYITPDDIKMGIWIDQHLPKNVLILNAPAPSVTLDAAWVERGLTNRDTFFSRLGDHQLIKNRQVDTRAILPCIQPNFQALKKCTQAYGATHVLFAAGEANNPSYVTFGKPVARFGNSYLFSFE